MTALFMHFYHKELPNIKDYADMSPILFHICDIQPNKTDQIKQDFVQSRAVQLFELSISSVKPVS